MAEVLFCVFEKNNLLGIFDSHVKAEGYSQALKDRKTKIKTRILNRPIELVSPSIITEYQ